MNLELRKVAIKDIQFSEECKVENGCLYVDPKKLEELVLEDSRVKSVSFVFHFALKMAGMPPQIAPARMLVTTMQRRIAQFGRTSRSRIMQDADARQPISA